MKIRKNPFAENTAEAKAYERARLDMFESALNLLDMALRILARRRRR